MTGGGPRSEEGLDPDDEGTGDTEGEIGGRVASDCRKEDERGNSYVPGEEEEVEAREDESDEEEGG